MSNKRGLRTSGKVHRPDRPQSMDLDEQMAESMVDTQELAGEQAGQPSRLEAMSARQQPTRQQISIGQANAMRPMKGNEPRGH
jgi:hypothetical protein